MIQNSFVRKVLTIMVWDDEWCATMKALLLAAGFGTRLEKGLAAYEGDYKDRLCRWIEGKPKGLVPIRGKPLADYLLAQLTGAGISVGSLYIQTNNRYYQQYLSWATSFGIPAANVFNNGVNSEDARLGPVVDMQQALAKIGLDESMLVIASDTLLYDDQGSLLDLKKMIQKALNHNIGSIIVYRGEHSRLSCYGIVQVDMQGKVIGFQEKPTQPQSDLVNASLHLYIPEMLQVIATLFPTPKMEWGSVLEHLYTRFPLFVEYAARRVDIGTIADVLAENP